MHRRDLIKAAGIMAVLPAIPQTARSDSPVDMNNPAVIALKYVEDATEASRPDKMGFKGQDQICENCRFYAGVDSEWGGCSLFQNRLVKAAGWCSGWIPLNT